MNYQDIHISDLALQQQFISKWGEGLYNEALQILVDNPQLDSKKFIAECMKKIGVILTTLETNYAKDFIGSLEIQFDRFDKLVQEFVYKRDWNKDSDYKVGNMVTFNNSTYICLKDNKNISPTATEYWAFADTQGEQGNSGINVNVTYDFIFDGDYRKNDLVVLLNAMFVATVDNPTEIPHKGSNQWALFLTMPQAKLIVSETQPNNLYDGLIWIQILK